MMKRICAVAVVVFSMGGSAYATSPCEIDVAAINSGLKSDTLAPDVKQQAEDLRTQAEKLCSAGHLQEAQDVAAQAKMLLNID